MAKIIDTLGKYLIVALITLAMFIFFLSVERKPLLADDNTSFVRAVVTQNDMKTFRLKPHWIAVTARRLFCLSSQEATRVRQLMHTA